MIYDWPIALGRTPCRHQKLMTRFMVYNPRSFCLSDPGTMKTLSALWAADIVMKAYAERGEECRALILSPLSIIEDAWGAEIDRNFLSRRTYRVVYGSAKQRLERLAERSDFYLLNYDGIAVGSSVRPMRLGGVAQCLADRHDIRIVIIDEARAFADSRTRRHRLVRLALGGRPHFWLLTGTPTSNGPVDAYGQAKLVNGANGYSMTGWRNATMLQVSKFKWVPRTGAAEKVKQLLSPAIRFALEDVWDGPEMVTETRSVELTAEQTKLLRQLRNGFVMQIASGKQITAVNEAAVRTKMLQVAQGAVYDRDHNWHSVDAAPRKQELLQVINDSPGKILCFVPLTSVLGMVYNWLYTAGYNVDMINGQTPAADRNQIIRSFQDERDGVQIILADPGSLSLGVNLFCGRVVLWYGPTERTEQYLQGCKRVHRPGQKHPVRVTRLVATSLEREIYKRLENNEALQGAVLKMIEENKL